MTLPLILARGRDPELRALDLRRRRRDPAKAEALCDRIAADRRAGARRAREALGYVAEAKAALGRLDLPEASREALDLVADGVVERYA